MPVLTENQLRRVEKNAKAYTYKTQDGTVRKGTGVAWEDVENEATAFARASLGKGLVVDKVPEMVRDFSESHPVRIFNVGPWRQKVMQGTLGTFNIPACPEGEPYVEMLTLRRIKDDKGKWREQWVPSLGALTFEPLRGDGQMPIRQHESLEIAHAIMGTGPFQNPQNRLTKFGCFISKCGPEEEPYPEELEEARKNLRDYLTSLVKDARQSVMDGKTKDVVGPDHYTAARILKLNPKAEPWMSVDTVEVNDVCPGCGSPYKKGIAVCKECKTILDEEKFNTLKRAS